MYSKTKKIKLFLVLFVCSIPLVQAQKVAVKTNIPYLATMTPNLGMEFALGKRTTFELTGGLNPFEFSETKKLKHWLVQPELRFWTCEAFNGHFFGIHGLGGQFNIGGWDIPVWKLKNLKDSRYEGYAYGGGISYGYQWILNNRWNLEFNVGAGYARLHYDKFKCVKCGEKLGTGDKDYWGPTKAAVSIIYFIK